MALLDYCKLQISIMTLIQLIHIKSGNLMVRKVSFATFVIVLDTDRRFAPSLHKTYLSHYEYRVMNRNVVRQKYVFENGKNVDINSDAKNNYVLGVRYQTAAILITLSQNVSFKLDLSHTYKSTIVKMIQM